MAKPPHLPPGRTPKRSGGGGGRLGLQDCLKVKLDIPPQTCGSISWCPLSQKQPGEAAVRSGNRTENGHFNTFPSDFFPTHNSLPTHPTPPHPAVFPSSVKNILVDDECGQSDCDWKNSPQGKIVGTSYKFTRPSSPFARPTEGQWTGWRRGISVHLRAFSSFFHSLDYKRKRGIERRRKCAAQESGGAEVGILNSEGQDLACHLRRQEVLSLALF